MSYSHVNKAKLIPCSCNTLVSSVYLPSTRANFVYPKNPRSHQTSSGVCITAGEPPDKHRSVWLDSSGLHSSWALTLRSRCDPYVCWSYYEPSGNQWAETHLGAHPLVISLISLLALAIWVLSLGQWLSAQCDWSGSSYRSLINGCGWGDGSFLFPSLFFSFSSLRSPLVPGRDVCDVSTRCTGWLTRAAGDAGWLAGWEIVTHMGVWHGRYTYTHTHSCSLHHTLSVFLSSFLLHKCYRVHCNYSNIRRSFTTSFPLGRYCCLIYHRHMLVPEWPPWEKHNQSKLLKDILTG